MKSPSTSRVSWSLLVTLCIWVASGDALSLDRQAGSQRRNTTGVAEQSSPLHFLLDVVGQGDVAEDAGPRFALGLPPADLALLLHGETHGAWSSEGISSHLLPLPRAPGA